MANTFGFKILGNTGTVEMSVPEATDVRVK